MRVIKPNIFFSSYIIYNCVIILKTKYKQRYTNHLQLYNEN